MLSEKVKADFREIRDDYRRAEYALQVRRYDLVVEIIQQVLGAHPENSLAHLTIARAYILKGHHREALASIKEALRLDPGNADTHVLYGNLLVAANKVKEAAQEYLLALELDPASALIHATYAAYLNEKKHDRIKAREHAQKALELDPADADYHMLLGNILAMSGKFAQAEQAYRQALHLAPDDAKILRNYGEYLLQYHNKQSEAYGYFSQAMARNPEDPFTKRDVRAALKLRHPFYGFYWSYNCLLRRKGRAGVVVRYLVLLLPLVIGAVQWLAPVLALIMMPVLLATVLFDLNFFIAYLSMRALVKVPWPGQQGRE